MKVFVPMSDRIVDAKGELSGDLVPFNTEFIQAEVVRERGARPANWIIDCDHAAACRRLFGQSRELSLA